MSSYLTAIKRNKPSLPMQYLASNDRIIGKSLDWGCGHGFDADEYGMEKYDPHYFPAVPIGQFETITCNYVLNVIDSANVRVKILQDIQRKLLAGGKAYITVRADRPALRGYTSKGTYQCEVILKLPVLRKAAGYITYTLDKFDIINLSTIAVREN